MLYGFFTTMMPQSLNGIGEYLDGRGCFQFGENCRGCCIFHPLPIGNVEVDTQIDGLINHVCGIKYWCDNANRNL